MPQKKKKTERKEVYKSEIFHLLMLLLEHAKWQTVKQDCTYEAMAKYLKFQHTTDWRRYQSSIHLLEDTDLAIRSAFEYQLGDLSQSNRDYGEMNLRLYGILNAVYLQMGAYEVIMNLLNYPNRQNVSTSFQRLGIYKLRGIAGAHTADYLHDEETIKNNAGIRKTTSFSIMQFNLEKTGKCIHAMDQNGLSFEFNLLEVLTEYEKMATNLLVQIIQHSKTFYKTKKDKAYIQERLEELLPNLMDYTKMNENEKYWEKQDEKIEQLLEEIEKRKIN